MATEFENILAAAFRSFGLDDPALVSKVKLANAGGELSDAPSIDEIGFVLRDEPAFKKRFPANDTRLKKGLPVYSVSQYLRLENDILDQMRFKGLPTGFYDDPATDLQGFIANDVSPQEVANRIDQGFRAVKEADPQVVAEFQRLYGVSEGDLAAYFLDPEKMRPEFDSRAAARQAQAAQIAAQATIQSQMGLTAAEAEALATAGVTQAQAQQGFGQIGTTQELLNTTLQGEQALTREEIISGTFGTRAEAAQRIATRKRQRQAAFEAGGGFAGQGTAQTALGTAGTQ